MDTKFNFDSFEVVSEEELQEVNGGFIEIAVAVAGIAIASYLWTYDAGYRAGADRARAGKSR